MSKTISNVPGEQQKKTPTDNWKPVEWPTLEELNKLHEDKTLTGTARMILEKSLTKGRESDIINDL